MEFKYGTTFLGDSPEAYERLLHDALLGDATLFTRADEVETGVEDHRSDPRGLEVGTGSADLRGRQPGPAGGRRAACRPRAGAGGRFERRTRPEPERGRWRGEGVRVERIVRELDRLHRVHQGEGGGHALTRTLNLIVAPSPSGSARRHRRGPGRARGAQPVADPAPPPTAADRLDAEASLECRMFDAAGRIGVCHDRVVLSADQDRLTHAASLLAPLLLADLPTVLWIPEPSSPIPDPRLLERSQEVLGRFRARWSLAAPAARAGAWRPGSRSGLGSARVLARRDRGGLRPARAAQAAAGDHRPGGSSTRARRSPRRSCWRDGSRPARVGARRRSTATTGARRGRSPGPTVAP